MEEKEEEAEALLSPSSPALLFALPYIYSNLLNIASSTVCTT